MSDYIQQVDFRVKDALAPNDPNKVIRGTEFDVEFAEIAAAIATKTEILPTIPDFEYVEDKGQFYSLANTAVAASTTYLSTSFTPLTSNNKAVVEAHIGIEYSNSTSANNPVDDTINFICEVVNNQTGVNAGFGDLLKYEIRRTYTPTVGGALGTSGEDREEQINFMFIEEVSIASLVGSSTSGYTFRLKTASISGEADQQLFKWTGVLRIKEFE